MISALQRTSVLASAPCPVCHQSLLVACSLLRRLCVLQRESLEDALRQLYVLDAIDIDGKISPNGRAMAGMPLDPSLARALLAAKELGCLDDMMTVAAMLSPEGSVFMGGKGPEQLINEGEKGHEQQQHRGGKGRPPPVTLSARGRALLDDMMADGLGDHVLLLRLYRAWEDSGCSTEWCKEVGVDGRSMRFARDVRRQLERAIGEVGDRRNGSAAGLDGDMRASKRAKHARSSDNGHSGKNLRTLRMALSIGFANRLARRMLMHNGYRTLGATSALAQVHPSAARLAADEDGLLPEWLVYHELVSTGRVYLSGVCCIEGQWAQALLPKLHNVDVARLSGGATAQRAAEVEAAKAAEGASEGGLVEASTAGERRNKDAAVEAARARYLARKAAAGGMGKNKR